ncbi:MAG: zinc ribbon domain-containing protein [Rubripirellula sp.]
MSEDWESCPHCGAEIKVDATFCRHCGSSDTDGWREEDSDVEIDGFDYDEFVAENFSGSPVNSQTRPLWRWVAVGLLLLFALGYLWLL